MKLPELPPQYDADEYGGKSTGPFLCEIQDVKAYGIACAQAALAAAAKVCDTTPPYPFRPSIEAAHAIRAIQVEP